MARHLHHPARWVLAPALAVGLIVAACGEEEPAPPEPTASPTPATSPASVWFVVDTRTGFRLVRETHDLPVDEAAAAAMAQMVEGADDPDYGTTWDPDTEVLGVSEADGTVTVDLSEDARRANAGSQAAALMVQQLVWTVTGVTDEDAEVQLTIEGEPAGELWGVLVWDEPVGREAPEDVRTFVQVDTPREGATVTSPVTVEGDANAFEATVPWRVHGADGAVVEEGFTMSAEGFTFAPWSFTVDLEPGTYTVEVREDDPSGGEGGTPMSDTKQFTVE